MSGKIMGLIWDTDLPQSDKIVLLSYADHADHTGNSIYPSVGLTAWKTGYSERSIQRITKRLVEHGYLVSEGKSIYGTNIYKINLEALPKRPPYRGGDKLTPPTDRGVTSATNGGDKQVPRGDKSIIGGDTAMTPEPSFKPSLKTSEETRATAAAVSSFHDHQTRDINRIYAQITGQMAIPANAQPHICTDNRTDGDTG
jgi:hypothetical protein